MSRLDRHIATVRSRLWLHRFNQSLAFNAVILAAAVLLGVLVNFLFRIVSDYLPGFPAAIVIAAGGAACIIGAGAIACIKRPTHHDAAAAIDLRLGLKEKFSTALYARPSEDLFARAAVADAESTAQGVALQRQFPLAFPKHAYTVVALGVAAWLLSMLTPLDLFQRKTAAAAQQEQQQQQVAAKEAVAKALEAVEAAPQAVATSDELRQLVAELRELNKMPKFDDPARASRRALQALQEVNNQVAREWDKARKYAEAQNALMQALQPGSDAKGPVGEARKQIANGNFDAAAKLLEQAVKNFEQMDPKQKEDQAKQMQQVDQQLQQLANNPQLQQQMQQQLQQMGANQQQAQQMQQLMQQAAGGDQQAAQKLQQMAQQLAQQMNNGQGPNAQQQQQLQQALQQMQAQANAQNQANALAQAAQQLAQAMAGAQQPQPGGQMNPQQANQLAHAQQQMQQALQNMQVIRQDLNQLAQQLQQMQQAMRQGQQMANGQGAGGGQPNGGQPQGQGLQGAAGGQGQFAQGNAQNQGQGQGGPGIGAGGNTGKEATPFGTKMEQSQSQEDASGKVLGSYLVKDNAPRGEQKMALAAAAEKAQKEAADEVDSDHASRMAQKVAQEYFRTMAKENK